MPGNHRNKYGLLARVNFPLYTVQMLTSRHVLVGGGGGSSKTGVANGFEIFELSHDGEKFIAEEVVRYETGRTVVMNCSTYSDNKHRYLVAGQESHCQLYNVQSVLVNDKVEDISDNREEQSVNRRKNKTMEPDNNRNNKRLKFLIKPNDTVQTDFLPQEQEPLQRVVRICPNNKLMATGGTDGCVRLWKFPALKLAHELKGHKQEIDDLDFSPCKQYLISIAKDGLAILWNYNNGKEVSRLTWKQPEGSKYLYKRSRFGIMEGEKTSALYMLANPTGRAGKQKAYLQKWLPSSSIISKVVAVDESLSALAVRDDGRFVAIGTMFSGSVSIYIAFSLQRVIHIPGAHSMFVTGLEFLPVCSDNTVTSISEAAVLSISVDNQICIHSLPFRKTIPAWFAIIVIIATIFFTFLLCSYIGI